MFCLICFLCICLLFKLLYFPHILQHIFVKKTIGFWDMMLDSLVEVHQLHGIISHRTVNITVTAMRTSKLVVCNLVKYA